MSVEGNNLGFVPISEVLSDYLTEIDDISEGEGIKHAIPTGYVDLDKVLGGFQRKELAILGGRTSFGKTAFLLNLAINAAKKHDVPVGIFSPEVSMRGVAARLLSQESGVDAPRIRSAHLNEQEHYKINAATHHISSASIFLDDTRGLDIATLEARTRELTRTQSIGLLMVDKLEWVVAEPPKPPVEPVTRKPGRQQVVRKPKEIKDNRSISKRLTDLAIELDIAILAATNAISVDRNLGDPSGVRVRYSRRSLANDADVVLAIYRDEKFNIESDKKGVADIIVVKNRNGPTGQVQLLFLERTMKFLDLEVYRNDYHPDRKHLDLPKVPRFGCFHNLH